jgi:hypothetical protein
MVRHLGGFPPFKDEDESSGNETEIKVGESILEGDDYDGTVEEFHS